MSSNQRWLLAITLCGAAACDSSARPDTLGGVEGRLADVTILPSDASRDGGDGALTDRGDVSADAPAMDAGPDAAMDVAADSPTPTDTVVSTDTPAPPDTSATDSGTPTDTPTDTGVMPPIDSPCAAPTMLCGGRCIDTSSDVRNCGTCGTTCPSGSGAITTCTMGACGLMCAPDFANCNMMAGDGCEVDTRTDTMNCGRCGTTCTGGAHATAACTMGTCRQTCETNFFDCNNMAADGCEIDGREDVNNCGGCGQTCRVLHGTATCATGMCTIRCEPGYYESARNCEPIPAPRLRSPMSGSMATTRRPLFEVTAAGATDGVLIEICAERTCRTVVATIQFTSGILGGSFSVTPSSDLPAGTLFWRGRGVINRTNVGLDSSAAFELTIPERSAPIATDWGASVDPNGDGFNDVLVGARDAGGAYLYISGPAGLMTTPTATLSVRTAMGFGASVAAAGDVNGDGYPDVAIGAPAAGQVFLFHGGSSGVGSTAQATLSGLGGSGFGTGLASAGDVNNDGYGDLLIGAPEGNQASVYLGAMGGILSTGPYVLRPPTGVLRYGQSVAGPGDIDGDGRSDVLVGATDGAFVHMGVAGSSSTAGMTINPTPVRIPTPMGAMGFGASVAGAGDVNGDGYLDVLVGAPQSATVYVFHGGARGLVTTPAATLVGTGASSFGITVASAGDVNLDGYGDVLVGQRTSSPGVVFLGGPTGVSTTALGTISAPPASPAASLEVATAGDLNRDRRTDFLLGDPTTASVGFYLTTSAGALGTSSGTLSSSPGSGFGASLAGAWR